MKHFSISIFGRNLSARRHLVAFLSCLLLLPTVLWAQVSPAVNATTASHNKQVIGYLTQWGPWKDIAGLIPKGSQNQLNIDYSQYTILNFSFFGVAVDGSLHSGDYRNPNIAQPGSIQQPAPLIHEDIYSSWDKYLLYGELDVLYHVADGSYAYSQGYRNAEGGWSNVTTGESGAFPLAIHKEGGAKGLLALCKENGVKAMASVGGWSMGKHFPETAADPAKRSRFVNDCKRLIAIGFDGIDLDWEYPGHEGMNFTGTQADFHNFTLLVEEIRAAIGPDKLITSCFAANPAKLQGFEWTRLDRSMDYYNVMTYDYNGGWSNKAGHNAPLYDYPGAEISGFTVDASAQAMKATGIPGRKINLGVGFYGRGVVTNGTAALNAPTVKRQETVSPDGSVLTAADFTNWPKDVWDGTPNYNAIVATTADWTEHWDDNAKVPYKTKGNFFLSYDNVRSIGLKSQYIKDQGLGGVIVWHVAGDWLDLASAVEPKGKLMYSPNTKAPLLNKINEVFADGSVANRPPVVSITAPTASTAFTAPATINIAASASDSDGSVAKVEFYNGSSKLGEDAAAPYTFAWSGVAAGSYTLSARVTDNQGAVASTSVQVTVGSGGTDSGCQGNGQKIVGYMPSWAGTAAEIQYDRLTHIIYAFIRPTTTGGLTAVENSQKLRDIVSNSKAKGVKVLIAVGGWSDLNNQDFQSMAANAQYRTNFINNLLALCQDYQLDGVDMDWEYPSDGADPANFATLMHEMGNALHSRGLLLTAAVAAYGYNADGVRSSVFADVDFLNLMAYDGGDGAAHSPYSYAEATLNYWLGRGLPASKAILGVPFYARPSWKSYRALLAEGADPYQDVYNGAYYNGITTIKRKSELALQRAGGIMIWELTQDAIGQNSLLTAIHEVIQPCDGGTNPDPTNQAPVVSITAPANGAEFTAPATITLTASASDPDGQVVKVAFYQGNTLLVEDTSAPYSYSWTGVAAGTYTITARATDDKGAITTAAGVSITVKSGSGSDCSVPAWAAASVYTGGARVSRNGNTYEAKWWTQGEDPALKSGPDDVWKLIGPCGDGGGTPTNTAPTVSISAPAGGSKYTAPAAISITATAADADGTVAKVEFFNGSSKLGEDTTSPYAFSWSGVAAGAYTITARATDDKGAATTSAAVQLTVESSTSGSCSSPAYVENGGYSAGSVVQNAGGEYTCRDYPNSGWCNGAAWAYAPGTGTYWQDAWTYKGSCGTSNARTAAQESEAVAATAGIKIYPNPSNAGSSVNIHLTAKAKAATVSITGVNGGRVYRYSFKDAGETLRLKLPEALPAGLYLIKVVADQEVYTQKYLVK